jgi:uncharacterized protein YbjQ (UPF0145 family)
MSVGQDSPVTQEQIASASVRLRPVVTMQPTVGGEAGEPIAIVVAEVICFEHEESNLFAGLGAFIRAELPTGKVATDIALEKLMRELCSKGRKLKADAIVSTNIKLLRGIRTAGHKLLKMTATGTAITLPTRQN